MSYSSEIGSTNVRHSNFVLENLALYKEEYKECIVDMAFSYVISEADVPDHVKSNIRCMRDMYTVVDKSPSNKKSLI